MTRELSDQQRLNALLTKSPFLMEQRINRIETVCGDAFVALLQKTLGERASRFSKPRAIIDSYHEGATMRVDCQGTKPDGVRCGVRATIQAVQDNGNWVLEGDQINFDRCENNPCTDCQEQCCHGGGSANRENT